MVTPCTDVVVDPVPTDTARVLDVVYAECQRNGASLAEADEDGIGSLVRRAVPEPVFAQGRFALFWYYKCDTHRVERAQGDLKWTKANRARYVKLHNVGREAHTYLTHIVRSYNDMAERVLFTQDRPALHAPVVASCVLQRLAFAAPFVSLTTELQAPDAHLLERVERLLGERFAGKSFWATQNAIFVVQAERIRRRNVGWYAFHADNFDGSRSTLLLKHDHALVEKTGALSDAEVTGGKHPPQPPGSAHLRPDGMLDARMAKAWEAAWHVVFGEPPALTKLLSTPCARSIKYAKPQQLQDDLPRLHSSQRILAYRILPAPQKSARWVINGSRIDTNAVVGKMRVRTPDDQGRGATGKAGRAVSKLKADGAPRKKMMIGTAHRVPLTGTAVLPTGRQSRRLSEVDSTAGKKSKTAATTFSRNKDSGRGWLSDHAWCVYF